MPVSFYISHSVTIFPLMNFSKNIYITGMMGSGKSYLGRQLSSAMNIPFTDLDDMIESAAGKSISSIFETGGETAFRLLERKALEVTFTQSPGIIATGGGTPCFFDNMQHMNEQGLTIWLQCETETLVQRLLPEQSHRPLLRNMDANTLHHFLVQKSEERKPFYQQCHYHIPENEQTISLIISKIYSHV